MPICKKCKQIPIIDFLDLNNLSLDCQCMVINRMSVKEFENELLCIIKKEETISNGIIKVSDYISSENELSNESSSKPKLELNEEIYSINKDKKENNEYLLKNDLKQPSNIQNNDSKIIKEISDTISGKESEDNYSEENKKNENYIYIKEGELSKCIKHNNKEFLVYCVDCKFDLCSECLNMESDVYSNTLINNKKHENHTRISLVKIKEQFDEINKLIAKIMKDENFLKNEGFYLSTIFKIIKCFMNNYEKYKCYNLYKSIENIKNFLENINNYKSNSKALQVKFKNNLKIHSEEELLLNIFFSSKISSINIQYKYKMNMSIFDKKDFSSLEEIKLVGNKIKDISSLLSCSFPNLKKLDLAVNDLDSSIIPILKQLNLPELIELNLYKNKITDTKIFELLKKFKKLKLFYIGENKFINDGSNNFYKFPESIEEFGITGNFEGENINFVKRLGIENLKIFYISRNKITNLKCLQGINFLRLGEFWAISNLITDIKEIMNIKNKENLWKINLKENNIKNFHELFNIIKYFPNLKILNLTNNKSIGKEEVDEMKKKIKEEFQIDLDIELND